MDPPHDVNAILIEREPSKISNRQLKCMFLPSRLFLFLIDLCLILWAIDEGYYVYSGFYYLFLIIRIPTYTGVY